jgi:hypothetical protein
VAPVYFVGFPAILKGWIERGLSLGFAFGMTPEAWRGDLNGRISLLTHEKALIIQTTIWNEASYVAGLRAAMKLFIDDYALRYPGIKRVEHTAGLPGGISNTGGECGGITALFDPARPSARARKRWRRTAGGDRQGPRSASVPRCVRSKPALQRDPRRRTGFVEALSGTASGVVLAAFTTESGRLSTSGAACATKAARSRGKRTPWAAGLGHQALVCAGAGAGPGSATSQRAAADPRVTSQDRPGLHGRVPWTSSSRTSA